MIFGGWTKGRQLKGSIKATIWLLANVLQQILQKNKTALKKFIVEHKESHYLNYDSVSRETQWQQTQIVLVKWMSTFKNLAMNARRKLVGRSE